MRPNLDSESRLQPDELPRDAKLEAGYIRYIRMLLPEGPNGEIRLETCIRRVQLEDESDEDRTSHRFFYSAISYSWGDPTPSCPIIVDGTFRLVATNLWHFLQHAARKRWYLRGPEVQRTMELEDWAEDARACEEIMKEHTAAQIPSPPGVESRLEGIREEMAKLQRVGWSENWLWIDALCIDQSDDRERTHQVGIMSEIFGRADQVISWLGKARDRSTLAMTFIASYKSEEPASKDRLPPVSMFALPGAIRSLCERPYWKRLWVFQELRHAKWIVLMCGDETIAWDKFTLLWRAVVDIRQFIMTEEERKYMTDEEYGSETLKQSLATRMMTLRTKPINFSLWNLLRETSNLECADQRDRVYALLSVSTRGHEGIDADYSRAVTPLCLAHRILQNKYAVQPPWALDNVLRDCKFLEDVFRITRGTMLPHIYII